MTAPPARSELILIRHAPAAAEGRLCGRSDVAIAEGPYPGLDDLRAMLARVPVVVSSPALRCRQTAELLWPGRAAPELDARLLEQDFGAWDGQLLAELPDLGRLSAEELAAHRPPGGESFDELCSRVAPALHALAERAQQGPLAVVCHAGVVRAALGLALKAPARGLAFEVAPLSLTRLRCYDGGFSIIAANWRPAA